MANSITVNSLIRGGNILERISKGENKLSGISESLNLSKGTTYRLLSTLKEINFVVQDPISLKYYLGPSILRFLSNPTVIHSALIVCAFEQMEYLRDLTRETVLLHIRAGVQRMCIEELESPENIKHTNGIGFIAPLYVGAAGKTLLAELEDRQIHLLLNSITLAPITPKSITDQKKLFKEINKIRKQGYAMSLGERIVGGSCLSVPIKDYTIPVALSVLGLENRFNIDEMMDLLEKIKKSAEKISSNLKGFKGG